MNPPTFTPYQKFVVATLTFLQFSVVLDFMILSPLGAILMPTLGISTQQFGFVVSAYAYSAGVAGFLSASFADRFDRKRLLMVFYAGFLLGTLLCGVAPSYPLLLAARVVTGLFGGVIGSIGMAIIADLFSLELRGRVMGFVQTGFATSQVLGLPLGLFLANHWGWHAPFLMISTVSLAAGTVMALGLRPVREHLALERPSNPLLHLARTLSRPRYLQGFAVTMLLTTGGFMLMPFGSAFSVGNLGISLEELPWVYMATGVASMIAGPFLGRLSDRLGKYRLFCLGSAWAMIMVVYNTQLGITPLGVVIGLNILVFIGISARMISSQALISAVPAPPDRGAFMAINSSISQLSGGVAATVAGLIVVQTPSGFMDHYDILGYVVASGMGITVALMYPIHRMVQRDKASAPVVQLEA